MKGTRCVPIPDSLPTIRGSSKALAALWLPPGAALAVLIETIRTAIWQAEP